ncbi:eCIS core domain-containing protein [Dyella flagellata]|uniref:eCIS core domain-containing protein n=1 Tax=Dyella flagellata TaxID=1867833 RepID=A0ABQ5XHH6_9GAMM|nr:DUF4157 domain-containing protein [Dyella flagellata]GLQ89929.1 hypothetical protein GCM10007898_35040 [Dyella flagellata]
MGSDLHRIAISIRHWLAHRYDSSTAVEPGAADAAQLAGADTVISHIGNQAAARRLGSPNTETGAPATPSRSDFADLPPVLRIGMPGGLHEREAERIANSRMTVDLANGSDDLPGMPTPMRKSDTVQHIPTLAAAQQLRSPSLYGTPGGGQALDSRHREPLERALGHGLSHVRIHDDAHAHDAAHGLQARAFTRGQHVFFGEGRYAPDTKSGRRLLLHELTHALQQRDQADPLIQADFPKDFAGRQDVAVEGTPVQPPGTLKVKTYDGGWVYAPYGIYSPSDVPVEYQDRIMESGKAFQWRNPGMSLGASVDAEMQRMENKGELTVRDMRVLSETAGSKMNIRVAMARVGNDYRFVGYDMSVFPEGLSIGTGSVTNGFVESEMGNTAGVGRSLFADRVVRTLARGVPAMSLEVYTSQRTGDFHAQIWQTIGRPGMPAEREHYSLDTRDMVRIALTWSDALSMQQRADLVRLATSQTAPSAQEAQAALGSAEVGSGGKAPGGFSSGAHEAMLGLAHQVNANVRRPVALERYEQLSDAATVDRIIKENGGYATLGGRLYRVLREGAQTRYFELNPVAIRLQIAPGGSAAAPDAKEAEATKAPIAPETPPTSTGEVKEGEVIVVPYTTFFEARDAGSGRALFGIQEGERWYRLEAGNGKRLEFDPVTGEQLIPTQMTTPGGQPLLARPWDPEPYTPAQMRPSGTAQGAVAAGGIVMVLNELLSPIGAGLQVQRGNIARGNAEISFWNALGANPVAGVWDNIAREPAPAGQKPDTAALFGHMFYPYVVDIDAARLRPNIALRAGSYTELQTLLHVGKSLGAISEEGGNYFAVVNRVSAQGVKRYEITEAVNQALAMVLARAESGLRNELDALSPAQRKGKLFRMHAGAPIYRSEQGQQFIQNAAEQMGPAPLVREIGRRSSNVIQYLWTGYAGTRVQVAPANADAYRSAAYAQYRIYRPIDDVWREVKNAGRSVTPSELPGFLSEPLSSFIAGPGQGATTGFGTTNYICDPENRGQWTMATGEIKSFWVSASDLTPIDEKDLSKD